HCSPAPPTLHGRQSSRAACAWLDAGAWEAGGEPVPEAAGVQLTSIKAAAQIKMAAGMRLPRGKGPPGLRGDDMTAILPHPAGCTVPYRRAVRRSSGVPEAPGGTPR